jgi:hypothetical protein
MSEWKTPNDYWNEDAIYYCDYEERQKSGVRLGIDARRLAFPSLRSLHHRAKRGVYHQPLWGCISPAA